MIIIPSNSQKYNEAARRKRRLPLQGIPLWGDAEELLTMPTKLDDRMLLGRWSRNRCL
ncbi:MAG: hypothetical protein HQK92_07240 [Nitrospirae bacterium]|nr:hypothetical protein [Nitrospirota bacterium]